MLPYRDSQITTIAIIAFFLLVAGYAYYEARGILFGPQINISSETTEVHEPFIAIKGQADRITSLSMNGKDIDVTEEGEFNEPYLLSPGLNRITLDATDKYGNHRAQVMQIVYTPTEQSAVMAVPADTSIDSIQGSASTSSASTTTVAQ